MSSDAGGNVDPQPFFTVAQYAARVQLSTKEIYREIQRGDLIAHRFRRRWRISMADALAYERLRRQS